MTLVADIIGILLHVVVRTFHVRNKYISKFLSGTDIDGQHSCKHQEYDRDDLHENLSEVLFVTSIGKIFPDDLIWLQRRNDVEFTVAEEHLLDSRAIEKEDILKELEYACVFLEHLEDYLIGRAVFENYKHVLNLLNALTFGDFLCVGLLLVSLLGQFDISGLHPSELVLDLLHLVDLILPFIVLVVACEVLLLNIIYL